jgi:hypothetical protein
MSPGPAPTIVVFLLAASTILLALGVLAWLADRNHPEPDPTPEPARDVCDLEDCDGRASVIYDARPFGEVLYICDHHAAVVREWVGRSIEAPFDQEAS